MVDLGQSCKGSHGRKIRDEIISHVINLVVNRKEIIYPLSVLVARLWTPN